MQSGCYQRLQSPFSSVSPSSGKNLKKTAEASRDPQTKRMHETNSPMLHSDKNITANLNINICFCPNQVIKQRNTRYACARGKIFTSLCYKSIFII